MKTLRLITLSTTCFISFLVFWLTFVVTVVWDFCWSFEQFWFETYLPATPYSWFAALFSIIAIWWFLEVFLLIFNKDFKLFSVSLLSVVLIFLLAVLAIFYNFNVYYKSTKGLAKVESLLLYEPPVFETVQRTFIPATFLNKDGKEVEIPNFDYSHWLSFRNRMTCDKGIDFNMLNKNEWEGLYQKYDLLKREEFERLGLDYDDPAKYSREQQ